MNKNEEIVDAADPNATYITLAGGDLVQLVQESGAQVSYIFVSILCDKVSKNVNFSCILDSRSPCHRRPGKFARNCLHLCSNSRLHTCNCNCSSST